MRRNVHGPSADFERRTRSRNVGAGRTTAAGFNRHADAGITTTEDQHVELFRYHQMSLVFTGNRHESRLEDLRGNFALRYLVVMVEVIDWTTLVAILN